jgi:hypothetical protein
MKPTWALLIGGVGVAAQPAFIQERSLTLPETVQAGSAFSIPSTGSGKATLYIVDLGRVLKREVQLGETSLFSADSIHSAGHFITVLTRESSPAESGSFDVVPATKPTDLSYLARPSRHAVGLHGGITGAAYAFDPCHNLITAPTPVSFEDTYEGAHSTADVPLKRGIAEIKMPAHPGARISVASGVVLGNEIRWEK